MKTIADADSGIIINYAKIGLLNRALIAKSLFYAGIHFTSRKPSGLKFSANFISLWRHAVFIE